MNFLKAHKNHQENNPTDALTTPEERKRTAKIYLRYNNKKYSFTITIYKKGNQTIKKLQNDLIIKQQIHFL